MKIIPGLLLILCGIAFADSREGPVGMLITGADAKVIRANSETPLDAKPTDLLFSGDSIRTGKGPATFLFCPGKTRETLGPAGEVRFDLAQAQVKAGKITGSQPAGSCFLPQVLRVAVASQQHYGVSMTRGGLDDPEIPPVAHDKLPAAVLADLAPFEKAAAAAPDDPSGLVGMAAVYENAKLWSNALQVYEQIRTKFPDAIWVKGKIFEMQQAITDQVRADQAKGPGGNTYALLVGISKFKNPDLALQFADRDAAAFSQAISSPRGGSIPAENIMLLTNEKATTAAIRNGFQQFLKQKATKQDTVIIMIAGHGTVETPGSRNAFILTYDSDPQDLGSTALPMPELQALFQEQLNRVGRVLMFVDVCKAGVIGTISNLTINNDISKLQEAEGDLFLFMASRPREKSLESPDFGGGHGAFSYYVLKGMDGDADEDKNGKVDLDELISYVTDNVASSTGKRQHPNYAGMFNGASQVADLSKPGFTISHNQPPKWKRGSSDPVYLAGMLQQIPGVAQDLADFDKALAENRLLDGEPNNAMEQMDKLKRELPADQLIDRQNQLRVALEDRAQDVLLRYLEGDQVPQTQSAFQAGGKAVAAARVLTPESLFLEGREDFFKGRALLFDERYPEAAQYLEDAVRFDPNGGYAYNALGIAYLEQAQFDKAIPAFRDAAKRAQHWAYPLHNLALAYVETGNYSGAIKSYEQAMRLAPKFSYLPYNLGLVYQRTGRLKDAERYYRQAMQLAPDAAEPYNALGAVRAAQGKKTEAENFYRQALQKDAKLLAARNNLALLLSTESGRFAEAVNLWNQSIAQSPEYLPSRLSLAEALASNGQTKEAAAQYSYVVTAKPDYVAARVELARLLAKNGQASEARTQLQAAAQRAPGDPSIQEALGDVESQSGNTAAARAAYQTALQTANDSAQKKSIQKKLKKLQ